MLTNARIIEVGKYRRTSHNWYTSEPYAIAFAYPASGPVIVKGMMREVREYLDTLPICHYRLSFWMHGKSRGIWSINRSNFHFGVDWNSAIPNNAGQKRIKHILYHAGQVVKTFRKFPNKHMKELDNFV